MKITVKKIFEWAGVFIPLLGIFALGVAVGAYIIREGLLPL
jgi:hypothetical protein